MSAKLYLFACGTNKNCWQAVAAHSLDEAKELVQRPVDGCCMNTPTFLGCVDTIKVSCYDWPMNITMEDFDKEDAC